MPWPPPTSTLFPYTTLFRSSPNVVVVRHPSSGAPALLARELSCAIVNAGDGDRDRKSTRLNSSHVAISYAVFCLKKKKYRIPIAPSYRHFTSLDCSGITLDT